MGCRSLGPRCRRTIGARRTLLVFAAFAAACTLAACTGSAPPVATSTSVPESRVDLGCGQLIGRDMLDAVSADLHLVHNRPLTLAAATAQTGFLGCEWQSPASNTSNPADLKVSVLPDAQHEYAEYGSDDEITGVLTSLSPGNNSTGSCHSQGRGAACSASALTGSIWTHVEIAWSRYRNAPALSSDDASHVLQAVTSSAVADIESSGPLRPPWKEPTTPWDNVRSCVVLDHRSQMDAALANPDLTVGRSIGITNEDPVWNLAVSRSHGLWCSWGTPEVIGGTHNQGVSIELVPGGGWEWSSLTHDHDVTSDPIHGTGAQAAVYSCQLALCWVDALTDHSWIRLSPTYSDEFDARALLTRALEALIRAVLQ